MSDTLLEADILILMEDNNLAEITEAMSNRACALSKKLSFTQKERDRWIRAANILRLAQHIFEKETT